MRHKGMRIAAVTLVAALTLAFPSEADTEAARITPEQVIDDGELHIVKATAYVDTITSTGRKPTEGLTVAGPREWIGCTCALYDADMQFLGFYEFMDVGYGTETGYGKSRLREGKHLGTIEAGECIDLYFDSLDDAMEWGKRTVYIQVIRAEG
jgi:3D (Asp-Asp-Asp) domain-containing protein